MNSIIIKHIQHYRKGKTLNEEHTKGAILLYLWKGAVRVYQMTHDGQEQTLSFVQSNSSLRLVCIYTNNCMVEMISDSEIVLLTSNQAMEAVNRDPTLFKSLLDEIVEYSARCHQRLEEIAFHSVSCRLANVLLMLADEHSSSKENEVAISTQISQECLATMVSSSRPSVNIALQKLRKDGLIVCKNKRIIILNITRLHSFGKGI